MAVNLNMRGTLGALMLGVAGLLAGCGSEQQDNALTLVADLALDAVRGGEDTPPAAPLVTRALVEQVNQPLMLAVPTQLGGATLFTRVGRNGGTETWRSPEQIGLTLDANGVLLSTRGLGFDLMASDVQATATALGARRDADTLRRLVHLDGDRQEVFENHVCSLRFEGRETVVIAERPTTLTRATETCRAGTIAYDNVYWIDQGGFAVRSVQWVSPQIGTLDVTYLAR
jgi:hypothetical protein